MMTTTIRTYSELIKLPTFDERFDYLSLEGVVGDRTFGGRRYLNQILYKMDEWKAVRNIVIIRDNGCDLGLEDYDIMKTIVVHHMNPITIEDILNHNPDVFDPEFLISTGVMTHKALHYSNKDLIMQAPVERSKNDTCPWRH